MAKNRKWRKNVGYPTFKFIKFCGKSIYGLMWNKLKKDQYTSKKRKCKITLSGSLPSLRANPWNGLFYMSRSSITVLCKPAFLMEQCWWGVEISGKLLYKIPGPQDKSPTIQEDYRGCTLGRSTQIYTKAFFYFLNFIRLHDTRANVISLTPTKIRLAYYDFHRNTHTQKHYVQIAWTEEHTFIDAPNWRMDFIVPIFKKLKIT